MSTIKCSVVFATFNRAHLLLRSLKCYEQQHFPRDSFEIVAIDDHSTDATRSLLLDWSKRTGIATTVLTISPKDASWRDCGAVMNYGIKISRGEHVILTHPEVMPGRKSVSNCVDILTEWEQRRDPHKVSDAYGLYACCRVYYLGQRDQMRIGDTFWDDPKGQGVLELRGIEGFYDQDENGNPDYRHDVTDKVGEPGYHIKTWESLVFGGMSRKAWKRIGGMLTTIHWGSIDVAFVERRKTLNIKNYTCNDPLTIVAHQNHDLEGDTKTPRDMDVWVKELESVNLKDPLKMVYPCVNELE